MRAMAFFLAVLAIAWPPGIASAEAPNCSKLPPVDPETTNHSKSSWPDSPGSYDLSFLWNLALHHHPELQQLEVEVEAARGKVIQAGRYPNPRVLYEQEELGAAVAPAGTIRLHVNQEIVTGGKRKLDRAIAGQSLEEAFVRLAGKRFEIQTRIRRGFYEYIGWIEAVGVSNQAVESLQKSVETTRQLVERVKTRPVTDLLRLEALLEEAKINQARSRISLDNSWRQLAVETGVTELPPPSNVEMLKEPLRLESEERVVERLLEVHTELRQAEILVQQASMEIRRAKAEAIPNIQVGGGYIWNFVERAPGGIVSVETPLPVWDRKQGRIYEAQARLAQSLAIKASVENRLRRETAALYASYQSLKVQVERLQNQVLPKQQQSLALVRTGYEAGAPQITFADVLLGEATISDTRLKLATAKRELWRALADVQGMMQVDIKQETGK